jgi:alpha-beta hydrolase superfamily lysophospholipase
MASEINLTPTGTPFDLAPENEANGDRFTHYIPTLIGSTWGNSLDARAGILLVHGLGGHSGWFEAFARRLKIRNIFSLAYDQAGFGRRKHEAFFSYKQWILDLEAAYNYLRNKIGDKPIYILGNSAGALVTLQSSNKIKPNGLILCSPSFAGNSRTFGPVFTIAALLQAFLAPDTEVDLPYNVNLIAEDKEVQEYIKNDPLRRFTVPARMLLELLKTSKEIERRAPEFDSPLLMFTAGRDKIVDNRISQRVFKRLASRNKVTFEFQDSLHDLMISSNLDELAQAVASWIAKTNPANLLTAP